MAAVTRKPVHRLSWVGFGIAAVALLMASYGSLQAEKDVAWSPLRTAREPAEPRGEFRPWNVRAADAITPSEMFNSTSPVLRTVGGWILGSVEWVLRHFPHQTLGFFLPFVLGLAAAWVGGSAMREIERNADRFSGNFQAVFAIMIGGLAAITAGCMIFSVYLWPHVPALYTM